MCEEEEWFVCVGGTEINEQKLAQRGEEEGVREKWNDSHLSPGETSPTGHQEGVNPAKKNCSGCVGTASRWLTCSDQLHTAQRGFDQLKRCF